MSGTRPNRMWSGLHHRPSGLVPRRRWLRDTIALPPANARQAHVIRLLLRARRTRQLDKRERLAAFAKKYRLRAEHQSNLKMRPTRTRARRSASPFAGLALSALPAPPGLRARARPLGVPRHPVQRLPLHLPTLFIIVTERDHPNGEHAAELMLLMAGEIPGLQWSENRLVPPAGLPHCRGFSQAACGSKSDPAGSPSGMQSKAPDRQALRMH
jgi:hypothetical protein